MATVRNKRPRVYNPATQETSDFYMPAAGIDFNDQKTLYEKIAEINKEIEDLKKDTNTSAGTATEEAELPRQLGYAVYSGYLQAPNLIYNSSMVSLGGALTGTVAKNYQGTATLLKGKWKDGTTNTTRNFSWDIKPLKVPVPHVAKIYIADTDTKTLELENFISDEMTLGGRFTAKDPGEYIATVTLKDTPQQNLEWLGTKNKTVNIPWRILPKNTSTGSSGSTTYSLELETSISNLEDSISGMDTDIDNIWSAISDIQKTAIFTTEE